MHRVLHVLSDSRFLVGVLLTLVAFTYGFGGLASLAVLICAAVLGMVPPLLGLMRVHLMGAVGLPLALGIT
jgi:TctA family transporter